ncbi:MAG: FKBP-type peptidyl-prolyl cis-trans isomerase [Coriobacteriales bacterium]|jgi:FKBP-type peptidyl-prolyl cis-trans isomerase 2
MLHQGQTVTVNYAGQLEDGYEFVNTWLLHEPAHFVIGHSGLLPLFEQALIALSPGQRTTVHIPKAQAYGEYDPANVIEVPRAQIPNASELPLGGYIWLSIGNSQVRVKVCSINEETVTIDCNSELAGHDLTFDIELVDDGTLTALDREDSTNGCSCDLLRESLDSDNSSSEEHNRMHSH